MKKIIWIGLIALLILGIHAEPFVWSVAESSGDTEVAVTVASGAYLYFDSIRFPQRRIVVAPAPAVDGDGVAVLTPGVWRWQLAGKPEKLVVEYQGCVSQNGASICLVPQTLALRGERSEVHDFDWERRYPAIAASQVLRSRAGYMNATEFCRFLGADTVDETRHWNFLWALLAAFLGGIALNLTPCVLPLIPINLGILSAGKTPGEARKSGLLYALGMAGVYGILGVAAVAAGANFGALNASPYFQGAVGVIFLVLAVAMTGIIPLDLSRFRGERYRVLARSRGIGLVAWGALSALLAGACVAPVGAAVVLFAAKNFADGNFWAVLLPLLLGVGMATPWVLLSFGIGILPRPGKFMTVVKDIFAVVLAVIGVWYIVGAIRLAGETSNPATELDRLEAALVQSAASGRPVLVDCWASWCGNCKKMEADVFPDDQVREALKNYTLVRFNMPDLAEPRISSLLKKWHLPGLPGFVVLLPR